MYGSGYGGGIQPQYQQLSRFYGLNELIYACTELIASSTSEPMIIGHRMRRSSPGSAGGRPQIQQLRRQQALQGRKNRANNMVGDAWLILNAFVEEVPNHPLIRLLNNPNPYMSRGQFWASIARDLLIAGDAFIFKARYLDGLLQGATGELWRLRPDRVKPDPDGDGSYIYTINGEKTTLAENDVIHIKIGQSPFSDFYGWSPLMAVMERARVDLSQRNFLAAFYETGGTGPGAILSVKGKVDQKDKDELRNRNRRQFGPGNFLELMILDQSDGITYTPLSLNRGLRDALPVDINSVTETRIAAAYGIPGSILGLLVAYANGAYAARKQDWQTLWDITMTPFLSNIDDAINLGLTPEFAGIDEAEFDLSDIRALAEDKFAVHDNARKNVDAGVWTIERARLETGEPATPDDGEHSLLPTRSTLVPWPLEDNMPMNPVPLSRPALPPAPAALITRAIEMIAITAGEERRVGRPRIEDDPEARETWAEAARLRSEGLTWAQVAIRTSRSERQLREYRNRFEDDLDE